MRSNGNNFSAGPQVAVRVDDGVWWATCPGCPGWSVAGNSWKELFRLVSEWHSQFAGHKGWTMHAPLGTTWDGAVA